MATSAIRLMMAIAMLAVMARGVSAQSSAPSYVRSRTHVGQIVWVTATDGVPLQGRVAAISDSHFEVSILGQVAAYRWSEIRVIEVRDPLKNGMILGGTIGGLALAQIPSPRTTENVAAYAVVGIGLGIAAGAYGDYLRDGREAIYRNVSRTVSIAPILLPKMARLSVVVRW